MPTKTKVFFDTNVLVYQFDHSALPKQKRALELVEQCILEERALISLQVVQEFMHVALNKFATKLSADQLGLIMADMLKPLCTRVPSFEFYERALGLYTSNRLNFYDALIIQAAIDLGCETLYSEDLHDGQQFGLLTIQNPFAGL